MRQAAATPRQSAAWHGLALILYAATGWAVVVHGASFTHDIWGGADDPMDFIWGLAWWPHALASHQNPFYTHMLWQPEGLNTGWATCVPALSFLAAPITALAGPVPVYNALTLAAPVLAALAAYALCLYVTRKPLAALFGGWLFGFSSFMMARQSEQLNQNFTCLLPLLVWLALARLDGKIGRAAGVAGIAVLAAAQAGVSVEVFATACLAAGFAWVLAWGVFDTRRPQLAVLAGDILRAAPLTALLLAPMFYAMFALPHDVHLPDFWPDYYANDLLNLIIPTSTDWLSGLNIAAHFPAGPSEQSGYLGLPLLVLLGFVPRGRRRYMLWLTAGLALASMGAHLWFAGRYTGLPMPWLVFRYLPLLHDALPCRLMLYASLAACVGAALALARPGPGRYLRLGLAALAVLSLLPRPRPVQPIPDVAFFRPGVVAAALGANRSLLILPFGFSSPALYWQVESHFAFAMAAGYMGFPPARVQDNTQIMKMFFAPSDAAQLPAVERYARATGVFAVVAGPGTAPGLVAGLRGLGWPVRDIDGVTLFILPHG